MARSMINTPKILNKFYVYDPNVSDTLGGLRVLEDKDDKGNAKDGTKHVLAVSQQVQWWIDQGLMGEKPVGEISESARKMLAQMTRGRSEDNDAEPARVPKYDKRTQSGMAAHVLRPMAAKRKGRKAKPLQEPYTTTNPDNPQAIAKSVDSPRAPGEGTRRPSTTPPRDNTPSQN